MSEINSSWDKGTTRSTTHCARCGRYVHPYGIKQQQQGSFACLDDLLLCMSCDSSPERHRGTLKEIRARSDLFEKGWQEFKAGKGRWSEPYSDWEVLARRWKRAPNCPTSLQPYMGGFDDYRYCFEKYRPETSHRLSMGICLVCLSHTSKTFKLRDDEIFARRERQIAWQMDAIDSASDIERFILAGFAAAWTRKHCEGVHDEEHGEGSYLTDYNKRRSQAHYSGQGIIYAVPEVSGAFLSTLKHMGMIDQKLKNDEFRYEIKKGIERDKKELYEKEKESPFAKEMESELERMKGMDFDIGVNGGLHWRPK